MPVMAVSRQFQPALEVPGLLPRDQSQTCL
jgi:hypothetical protein